MSLPIAMLAAGAASGLAAGWLHFRSLREVSVRLLAGQPVAGLMLARWALLLAWLIIMAWLGPAVAVAALLGLLVARSLVLRKESP